MRMIHSLLWLGLSLVAASGWSCSSSPTSSCTSLCTEAQAQSCTNITGDCGIFCTSLVAVSDEGSCTTQYTAYEACLQEGAICSTIKSCAGQSTALDACVLAYCAGHTADTDCITIVAALK